MAAALLAVGATAVNSIDPGAASAGGCEDAVTLRVAATEDLAPVIAAQVGRLRLGCDRVVVDAVAPAGLIVGLSHGEVRPPDVWVPSSTLWLDRAGVDALAAVRDAEPVATSPLVLAMTQKTADLVGDGARPRLADLVRVSGLGGLRLLSSAERLSPERVGTVVALSTALRGRSDARAALAGLLRNADAVDGEPALPTATGDLVPATEQAVVAGREAGQPLTALYPGSVTFDYPFAVLATDPQRTALAAKLRAALLAPPAQAAIRAAGFRDVRGVASDGTRAATGAPARLRPSPALDQTALELAERTLVAVNQRARLLAVVDVSGSMAWPVGGQGAAGPSRITVATGAAGQGLSLYPDGTEVGLWLFPAPDGTAYRAVAPVRPVDNPVSRARLAGVLEQVAAVPGGSTPLYDATLAAVRSHRRGWQSEAVNAVVVLSDGADTVSSTRLPRLLDRLRAVRDSDRPVPVITIGFGPDSDDAALTAIARASGGASYQASTAADIRRIFLDALGQRACRPDCG